MAHQYAIELKGITKTFGSVVANKNVELNVKPGEILGLIGENGAGKSTILKILNGIYPTGSYTGTIKIEGEEVSFAQRKNQKNMARVNGFLFCTFCSIFGL